MNSRPERRNAGRKVVIMASWLARSWFLVRVLMAIPMERDPAMNTELRKRRRAGDPRKGTPKRRTPVSEAMARSMRPIPKYGSSLPIMISQGRSGLAASISIVPVSHSRAIVSEVSSAEITMSITAMSPGMIAFLEARDSLKSALLRMWSCEPPDRRPSIAAAWLEATEAV